MIHETGGDDVFCINCDNDRGAEWLCRSKRRARRYWVQERLNLQLSKTDFLQFLHCPKSLWLLRRKPTLYQHGAFSDYLQKIVTEGYEVELYLKSLFSSQIDSDKYSYQTGSATKLWNDPLYKPAHLFQFNQRFTCRGPAHAKPFAQRAFRWKSVM